jgi:hypothetical protein
MAACGGSAPLQKQIRNAFRRDLRPLAQLRCPPLAATVGPKRGVLHSKTPEVIAALRQLLMFDTLAANAEKRVKWRCIGAAAPSEGTEGSPCFVIGTSYERSVAHFALKTASICALCGKSPILLPDFVVVFQNIAKKRRFYGYGATLWAYLSRSHVRLKF